MGFILEEYFQYANEKGGALLRMKIAVKTGITNSTASVLPDSGENIEKIKSALHELLPGEPIPDFEELKSC